MPTLRLSTAVLAAALSGCATMKVSTEYDPSASFAAYRSYAWNPARPGPEQPPAIRNPAVYDLVVQAIEREMAAKGFVRTTPEQNPDFLVSVLGWAQARVEVSTYGYAYGGAYMYGPGHYGPGMAVPVAQVRQYTDGTLLLDFVDAKTMKLVWRGTATDTLADPAAVPKVIDAAAKALLEAYPPPPKK